VNWTEISRGAWPDNAAFASLSREAGLEEIEDALGWAADHQFSDPQGSQRVASAALHLMDGHDLDNAEFRAWFSNIMGLSAIQLGDTSGGGAILRGLIDQPPLPGTVNSRRAAMATYAGAVVGEEDPDGAIAMLRNALDTPAEPGRFTFPEASFAISLGALLRRTGQIDEAQAIFEEAIAECETAADPHPELLARLHGNLGNLCLVNLADYPRAAAHYAESVAWFDASGEKGNAARRFFHLVGARLDGGEFDEGLRLLREGEHRIDADVDGFRDLIENASWIAAPDATTWEVFFGSVTRQREQSWPKDVRASLAAALVVLRYRAGDRFTAVRLAHDLCLAELGVSLLMDALIEVLTGLWTTFDCVGVAWPLFLSHPDLAEDDVARAAAKFYFTADLAAMWLCRKANEAAGPQWRDEEFLRDISGPAMVHGIGAVPLEPPGWLGPVSEDVRVQFTRLRGLYPSMEELAAEGGELLDASTGPDNRVLPGQESRLRRAVQVSDMLGVAELQVRARRALALGVMRGDGLPRERSAEAYATLDQAGAIARGNARQEVEVGLARATLLKEAVEGDERTRLAAAAEESRRALMLAEEHDYRDLLAACALTLGNALIESDRASQDDIREAVSVLERGLLAFRADESSAGHIDESQLLNSLGLACFRLGERERSAAHYRTAIEYLTEALAIRQQAGFDEATFRTINNLLAVHVDNDELTGKPHDAEVIALANLAIEMAPRVSREVRALGLTGIGVFLEDLQPADAKGTAIQGVELARELGTSLLLVRSLLNAASIYLRAGDLPVGRGLLEEATTTIEALRHAAGTTRSRAELTERFDAAYTLLGRVLAQSQAAAAEQWWAVERNTGRTLLEGIRHRGVELDQASVMRALEKLPPGTAVIHTYRNDQGAFAYFFLRSAGGSVQVRRGTHSVELRDMALGLGGTADGRGMWTPIYTPGQSDNFRRQLSWLGTRFLGPLLAESDLAGITRLVLIGQYFAHLPWHAVPVPVTGKPLGATWEVITVPSVATLAHLITTPAPEMSKAVFVACDPTGSLRHHIAECRHAFAAVGAPDKIVLTDTSRTVTKRNVRDLLSEADLFHFSGHGTLVPGEPEKSGLWLSDGLFTVAELEDALSSHAPGLVFLSSCDSAATDTRLRDGPTLASVFLQGGARAVIGASWPVPDYVAALTAREFYEKLGAHDAAGALMHAQTELMANPAVGADWGTFRLYGWA
jgi:tetratricopeptide (TPR) repeat protein